MHIVNNTSVKRIDRKRKNWLTIRENEFLGLLKRFQNVKAVAEKMGFSYRRAETMLANIRRKWTFSANTNNKILAMSRGDRVFLKFLCEPARRLPVVRVPPHFEAPAEDVSGEEEESDFA